MTGWTRITKAEWQRLGGLKNSKLARKTNAAGRWIYYKAKG